MFEIKGFTNRGKNWKSSEKKLKGIQTMVKRIGFDNGFVSEKYRKKRKPIVEVALQLKNLVFEGRKEPIWFASTYVEDKLLLVLKVAVNGEEEIKQELGITGFSKDFMDAVKYVEENIEEFNIIDFRKNYEQ